MSQETQQQASITAARNISQVDKASVSSHLLLWLSVIFFICAYLWADNALLEEVTNGQGKVIPSRQIQVVQNLEGGIVEEILVREGEIVKRNQILTRIDDTQFEASFQESKTRANMLKIKIARLSAIGENKPFKSPDDTPKELNYTIKQERNLYHSQMNELKALKNAAQLADNEYHLTKPLVKKGAVSKVELMHLARTVTETKGQTISFMSRILKELNDTRGELATLEESTTVHKDKLHRTNVRSPVKGIIKKIHVSTIGGVVQPGSDIMEIVPMDDTLLIEAKIKPADIGFIHPNQRAMVKITAYDYSIYGGLEGQLEQISADTLTDEKKDTYYLIRVRTKKNYLGTKEKPLYIIPGMQASVDLITGEKTVLDYILKPILKTKNKALRER